MPDTVTPNTRVPFGSSGMRNRKMAELTDSALTWIVGRLDSDLAPFAVCAQAILDDRAETGGAVADERELEAQADEFLRKHGFGAMVPRRRR